MRAAHAGETWFVLDSGLGAPAWNMALDAAILESIARLGRPVLRFYGWSVPAATFGYSQRFADVQAWTDLRPLQRRPTGGGVVPHAADWTYSFAVPPGHRWCCFRARESYCTIHGWIRDAFGRLEISVALAPEAARGGPGQCFLGAEQDDVVWKGRKVAGAAQRRTRQGLLIQGSIQPPPGSPARGTFQAAMLRQAAEAWGCSWQSWAADPELLDLARRLERVQYGQPSFNESR